jgi:hypothetical protein
MVEISNSELCTYLFVLMVQLSFLPTCFIFGSSLCKFSHSVTLLICIDFVPGSILYQTSCYPDRSLWFQQSF